MAKKKPPETAEELKKMAEKGWKKGSPADVLDGITAANRAKADAKKAPKPSRIDAILKRKKGQKNPETGLNDQQEMFCREYLKDFNATQAALRAGYSPKSVKSAQVHGSKLLLNTMVRVRLAELQKPTFKKLEVTAERIMDEVAKVAFASLGNFIKVQKDGTGYIDLKDVTPEMFAALESYEVTELPPYKEVVNGEEVLREVLKIKVKLSPKLDALEKLMRRHNLVKPIEVTHTHQGKIAYETPDLARRVAFLLAKAAKMQDTKPKGVTHGANVPKSDTPGPVV